MKLVWFRRVGWVYIPVHLAGYAVTLLAIAFMVPVSMAVFRDGRSITGDLYQIFVYGTCTAFWWKWIADKTSE